MHPPAAGAASSLRASHLSAGAEGMVTAVEGHECVVERLAAVGLVPGTRFRVLRGGSPMALAVGETRLGLGPEWAGALRVVSL